GATAYRPAVPLSEGPHVYQVTALNPVGVARPASPATVLVDTIAPSARVRLSGRRRVGAAVRLQVRYSDVRPPEPPAASSGVAYVNVNWGDGFKAKIGHGKFHVYRRPGLYKLTVAVADRAGNKATVVHFLRIVPAARVRRAAHSAPRRRR
ncbi:MAG: hypothetical protein M3Z06_09825, partial [Actinomycetota bacterium]|nr:hypothetical protein [Actinomycetota bacterium]